MRESVLFVHIVINVRQGDGISKIHIKRRHGGYLLGRSSGQYTPNNPFSYNKQYNNIGTATVADSIGDILPT